MALRRQNVDDMILIRKHHHAKPPLDTPRDSAHRQLQLRYQFPASAIAISFSSISTLVPGASPYDLRRSPDGRSFESPVHTVIDQFERATVAPAHHIWKRASPPKEEDHS